MKTQAELVLELMIQFERVSEAHLRTVQELGVLLVRAEALVKEEQRVDNGA